jgi:hypothetical protein
MKYPKEEPKEKGNPTEKYKEEYGKVKKKIIKEEQHHTKKPTYECGQTE